MHPARSLTLHTRCYDDWCPQAKDARNFVNSLQYWLGGNTDNLENLLLNVVQVGDRSLCCAHAGMQPLCACWNANPVSAGGTGGGRCKGGNLRHSSDRPAWWYAMSEPLFMSHIGS